MDLFYLNIFLIIIFSYKLNFRENNNFMDKEQWTHFYKSIYVTQLFFMYSIWCFNIAF